MVDGWRGSSEKHQPLSSTVFIMIFSALTRMLLMLPELSHAELDQMNTLAGTSAQPHLPTPAFQCTAVNETLRKMLLQVGAVVDIK